MNAEINPHLWTPDRQYYIDVAESDVNPGFNFTGRLLTSIGTTVIFGRPKVVTTSGFDEALPLIKEGNVIVGATHRHGADTVMLPSAVERAGIHHARPVHKVEISQNPILRWVMPKLGSFAVDRMYPDMEGFRLAHEGILGRGGVITNYAEGTRVHTNVLEVAKIKSGIVVAATDNNSLIVPAAFAGLSIESTGSHKDKKVIARDKKSWFGLFGPKVVFALGDPFQLPKPTVDFTIDRHELTRDEQKTRVAELREMSEQVRKSLQETLDLAYRERGSSLEQRFDDEI